MSKNLLKPEWVNLDSHHLDSLLRNRVGGRGQLSGEPGDNRLYLPQAGKTSRLALSFKGNRISAVERGADFDADEWSRISTTIHALLNSPPDKIGRDIAFSGKPVTGWWRGAKSGVQIRPPPVGAPTPPPNENAEHPFILEFPLHSDAELGVTFLPRERTKLVRLLNVLLSVRVNDVPQRNESVWANTGLESNQNCYAWLKRSYFADIGQVLADALSPPDCEPLAVIAPDAYYSALGRDANPLRVPSDLDESICRYRELGPADREKFDRALFWLDVASRQWTTSMSASFASLVSAIESLTERGSKHRVYCGECG